MTSDPRPVQNNETEQHHLLDGLDDFDPNQEQIQGHRVLKKTSLLTSVVLIVMLLIGVVAGVVFIRDPQSLARIHGYFFGQPLQINGLNLLSGSQALSLVPGEVLEIHPGQSFRITGLDTNRWQNYDLNLSSPDFPLNRVTNLQAASLLELLGLEAFAQPRRLHLQVREKGNLLATFTLSSSFTALDWGLRGDAAVAPADKAILYHRALELNQTSSSLRDKLAQALVEAGQGPEAASLYEEKIKRSGPSLTTLNHLLDIYTALKLPQKRLLTLSRLITLDEAAGRTTHIHKIAKAQIYRNTKQNDKAATIYEDLAAKAELSAAENSVTSGNSLKTPNSEKTKKDESKNLGKYLGELIAIYRELNLSEKEISTLKRLAAISPSEKNPELWSKIATLYDQSGDKEGRLAAWETLAGHLPAGPDQTRAFSRVAQLAFEADNVAKAKWAYQQLLKDDPDSFIINLSLARLAGRAGNKGGYRALLSKTLELQPDNIELRKELARSLQEDGQKNKARDQYLAILKSAPKDRDTRLTLIALLKEMKDRRNLKSQKRELLKQEPNNLPVAYNLGVMHFQDKQWKWASMLFKTLVEKNTKDQESREYLLLTYQHLGQKKEMLTQALTLYQQDPSQTVYRDLMLNTYENAKDWKNYTNTAAEITKLRPRDSESWRLLARGQKILKKRDEEAHSLWMLAETTDKKKGEAWLATARAHAALNKNKKAIEAYKKILAIEPDNQRAEKALLELRLKELKTSRSRTPAPLQMPMQRA